MIRRFFAILLSIIILSCLAVPAYAQESSCIVDDAALLLPEEISYLEEYANEIRDHYGIDAVVLTVDSLRGKSAQNYADDFYDTSGYAQDGVLFLLAMKEREWYISTSGAMIYVLTDYGIQHVGEGALPYLSEGLWFEAFCTYLYALPEYLEAYKQGAPIDGYADYSGDYYHGDQEDILYYEEEFAPSFGLSLLCGVIAASIAVLIMRLSMNTKRAKVNVSEYLNKGSWKLTHQRDIFLYSRVTKTRKQENNTSSGGGSSVHRSSGNSRHGGGGGKF